MKNGTLVFWMALLSFGCDETSIDTTLVTNTTTAFSSEIPTTSPEQTLSDDLINGQIIDTSWADDSNIACWIGTEESNFSGNHLFYETTIESLNHMTIALFPTTDVDASLYVLMDADGTPPDINSAVTCEASADWANNDNPGATELVDIYTDDTQRNVIIGVAGANGVTEGKFDLVIWSEFFDPQ